MAEVLGYFSPRPRPVKKFSGPSLTKQSEAQNADIKCLVDRFVRTGAFYDPFVRADGMPLVGDFTEVSDFATAQQKMVEAEQAFWRLPAKVRDRFGNDVGRLLAFVADANNKAEAIELGLMEKPIEKEKPPVEASAQEST